MPTAPPRCSGRRTRGEAARSPSFLRGAQRRASGRGARARTAAARPAGHRRHAGARRGREAGPAGRVARDARRDRGSGARGAAAGLVATCYAEVESCGPRLPRARRAPDRAAQPGASGNRLALPLPRRAALRLRRLAGDGAALPRAARRRGHPRRARDPARALRHERRCTRRAPSGASAGEPLVADLDPVSWMVIEHGWSVVDAEGDEVGRIDEVLGDEDADIFNGDSRSSRVCSGRRRTCLQKTWARSSKGAFNYS